MNEHELQTFYQRVILPQFRIDPEKVKWGANKAIGPDEFLWTFSVDKNKYVLIWEDFGGLGSSKEFLKEELGLTPDKYKFVEPISKDYSPSIRLGFGKES